MSSINSLLKINIDAIRDFPLLANRVADHQTERVINKNMKRLNEIKERMLVEKPIEVPKNIIYEVIKKVEYLCAKENHSLENWSSRELRIISYYLMYLRANIKAYRFALDLLDRGWRDMYFNGLVFYLMYSWCFLERECREATGELVMKKLQYYQGNNRRYLILRNHANLFDNSGPLRLAAILRAKNVDLFEAPTVLGFKNTTFNQSYYSDVIIKYVEQQKTSDLEFVGKIFDIHNLDRTKKLVFANLVEKEEKSGNAISRMTLCRFINNYLGDVTLAATWAPFSGATDEDARKLKHAKEQVYLWFAQQIIEVFFEVCVQDPERKEFWLEYINELSGFKIVGSTAIKMMLRNDRRIGSTFIRHFIETQSSKSQTSALVFFIRNKMIVEFSDVGSVYVYNKTHHQVKLVTTFKSQLYSTNDLKVPSIGLLVEDTGYGFLQWREEGRLTHRGSWQHRMSNWMQRIIFTQNNDERFNTKDDELFKATKYSTEEFSYASTKINQEEPINSKYESSLKTVSASIRETKEESQKTLPIYTTNIKPAIYSKWVNGMRVVADEWGFYMNSISASNKYARLRNMFPGEMPIGSIWIKGAKIDNWSELVHFCSGAEITIGYYKDAGGAFLFKESLGVSETITINLR